jgi:hypothetical protein
MKNIIDDEKKLIEQKLMEANEIDIIKDLFGNEDVEKTETVCEKQMENKMSVEDLNQVDSIVQSVLQKFIIRSKVGKEKYGTDLDRNDLKVQDWITHAQEELMDGILYLEKLKQSVNKINN